MKITFEIADTDVEGLRESIKKGIAYQIDEAKHYEGFTEAQIRNIRILVAMREGLKKAIKNKGG